MSASNVTKLLAMVTLFGSCALSGCALVPIPYSKAFPGPVKRISVLDAQIEKEIPNAKVNCEIEPFTNWCTGFPPHFAAVDELHDLSNQYGGKPVASVPGWYPNCGEAKKLVVSKQKDGIFEVNKRSAICVIRPWGLGPLGWAIHEDYVTVITASAPGYCKAVLTYYPGAPPSPGWTATEQGASCDFIGDGDLLIRLQPLPGSARRRSR